MADDILSEHDLIIKLKCGDEKAFNTLFYQYERLVLSFAIKLMPSLEDAQEVVQEVFYRIWKNRVLLDENKSFKAFIFTVARNYIYNQLSKKVSETTYKHYCTTRTHHLISSTEEELNFRELDHCIKQIISQMPERRKQVFTMSRYEGLNNQEIAQRLYVSVSTIENHMNIALKQLKKNLSVYEVFLLFVLFWF